MSDTASYVYAAGRAVGELSGIRGLRDAPLRVVRCGGLDAIVSSVDLQEFGEAPLREHLEDLGWLEEVARSHDRVVRAVWSATGAVAPFRLATICTTDDAVRIRLTTRYDELAAALDRVAGRSEWTVKAFRPLVSGTSAGAGTGTSTATSGTTYLMRRREQLDQQRQAAVDAQAVADDIHRRFAGAADACRRLPPQDRRLTGYDEPMILNGAYLVDDREGERFRSTVEAFALGLSDVRLTVDGPWPPYSFTSLESA
ncbi:MULTISPECIES: GvpL/GvpF family gas vesicle protein [Kribbella]|uniref:GvpL/GvpF family gas vesicle protein n=1 Tax=Kribbella karoonensis TaxID=324851 RepID=A0ABP4NS52_9ACTN